MPEWITIAEAVELTGYHADTIREFARDGVITGRKVATVWLVDKASVLAFLRQAEKKGEKRGPKPHA